MQLSRERPETPHSFTHFLQILKFNDRFLLSNFFFFFYEICLMIIYKRISSKFNDPIKIAIKLKSMAVNNGYL